jgi:hypothetical protein
VKFTESINDVFPSDKNINNPYQFSSLNLIVTLTKQIPLSSVFVMDTSSSNNARVIVNPYSINPYSRAAAQLRREQLQSFYGLSSQAPTNQASVATTMGVQSQRRGGSVKKCQKGVLKC